MHEHHVDRVHPESVVLDIGGDIGALLLHTGPEHKGREYEISSEDSPDARTHVEILERRLESGEVMFVGTYYGLREGNYILWGEDGAVLDQVFVKGGEITTADWR